MCRWFPRDVGIKQRRLHPVTTSTAATYTHGDTGFSCAKAKRAYTLRVWASSTLMRCPWGRCSSRTAYGYSCLTGTAVPYISSPWRVARSGAAGVRLVGVEHAGYRIVDDEAPAAKRVRYTPAPSGGWGRGLCVVLRYPDSKRTS